jgi:hypothetical protein
VLLVLFDCPGLNFVLVLSLVLFLALVYFLLCIPLVLASYRPFAVGKHLNKYIELIITSSNSSISIII